MKTTKASILGENQSKMCSQDYINRENVLTARLRGVFTVIPEWRTINTISVGCFCATTENISSQIAVAGKMQTNTALN